MSARDPYTPIVTRRTEPRVTITSFVCIVCKLPREDYRKSGAGETANLVCSGCCSRARNIGQSLKTTRGDRDILKRLSIVRDQLWWEAKNARWC